MPPNRKWGLDKSGGTEKPVKMLSLENFSLVGKNRGAEASQWHLTCYR